MFINASEVLGDLFTEGHPLLSMSLVPVRVVVDYGSLEQFLHIAAENSYEIQNYSILSFFFKVMGFLTGHIKQTINFALRVGYLHYSKLNSLIKSGVIYLEIGMISSEITCF